MAEAILYAAETSVRDIFVGGGAKVVSTMSRLAPRLTDRVVERVIIRGTHSGRPRKEGEALHRAGGGLRERGDYPGMVRNSTYTRAMMHPMLTSAAAVGAGLLVAALWRPSS